jgi:sulfonate transport system permease protein
MSRRNSLTSRISAWVVPMLLVLLWEIVVRFGLVPPSQSAAPSTVIVSLAKLIWSGILINHALYSLMRLFAGVMLGTIAGVLTSVVLASYRRADKLFSPTLQLFAGVPIVLWMPFCVMFFGTGETFKVSLAAISTFFLVNTLTFLAISSIDKDYVELAEIYEKGFRQKVQHVLLPAATPAIFSAVRAALALGWIVLFFVEYAASTEGQEGLGWFIADARAVGKIEEEFAGLLFLAVLAFTADRLLAALQRRLLDWSDTVEMAGAERFL